uniref:Uncharacterized protein n=1 Tax=Oryza glumipatula TaxID=40148 RepID=A0A0D9YQ03_9ORYZ
MGNCLQSGGGGAAALGDGKMSMRRRVCGGGGGGEEEDEAAGSSSSSSVMKVKMVLTKAELEWLMAQLKAGDRRLEDVLQEMARKRNRGLLTTAAAAGDACAAGAGGGDGADGCWRPSLESIVEGPEMSSFSFDY